MKIIRRAIPFLALLLFSLSLRITFYVGVGSQESLDNVQAAWALLQAFKAAATQLVASGLNVVAWVEVLAGLRAEFGFAQMLALLPVSMLFWGFGASEWSGIFVALVSSLLVTVLVYLVAEMLYGQRAAVVAGMLWALLPLGISNSTQAVITQPLVMLFVVAVYLLLKLSERDKAGPFLLLGVTMTALALISISLGVTLFVVATIILGRRIIRRPFVYPIVAGSPAVLFSLTGMAFAPKLLGLFERLLGEPGLSILFPLGIVVLSQTASAGRINQNWVKPLSIAAVAFLLLEFAQGAPSGGVIDALLLLFWLPVVLLTAAKVAIRLPERRFVETLGFLGLGVLLAAWLLRAGQQQLIPNFEGLGWISAGGLYYGLRILSGFVVLAIALSPLIFDYRKDQAPSRHWSFAFFASLSLVLLLPAWRFVAVDQAQYLAVRQAVNAVNRATDNMPQYLFSNRQLFAHVDFLEGFDLDAEDKDYVIGESVLTTIQNGDYLYWDKEISQLPETGAIQKVFGRPGQPRVVWLEVMGRLEAKQELQLVQVPGSSMKIYTLAQNAGDPCAAIDAWILAAKAQSMGHDIAMLRVSDVDDCYRVGHENKIDWLFDPYNYYPTYIQRRELDLPQFEDPVVRAEAKYTFFDDPRIWSIETVAEPNSVYYYAVTINARESVMALYWEFEGQEDYAYHGTYNDFVELSVILVTPDWDSDQIIRLSPALAGHYGFISIASVQFEKLELKK